jgi:hypothetical protein
MTAMRAESHELVLPVSTLEELILLGAGDLLLLHHTSPACMHPTSYSLTEKRG